MGEALQQQQQQQPPIAAAHPDPDPDPDPDRDSDAHAHIELRPVHERDVHRGLFDVLSQLTSAPPLSPSRFAQLVAEQRRLALQLTVVAVDHRRDGRVVATGSVFLEPKLIRAARPCAHVEDVVVCRSARAAGLGRRIILHLVQFARARGCYKVILDCAPSNVPFYEKCGFRERERQMALYF